MRLLNKNRSIRGRPGKITAVPRRVAHDAKFPAVTRLQSRVELQLQADSRAAVERQSPKHVEDGDTKEESSIQAEHGRTRQLSTLVTKLMHSSCHVHGSPTRMSWF